MTNIEYSQGKVFFVSKDDAERGARIMSRKFNEHFTTYQINQGWAVGGVFYKKHKLIKTKSLDQIKNIWQTHQENEENLLFKKYVDTIKKQEIVNKISTTFGSDSIWILVDYSIKKADEVGFKNDGRYLVLDLTNGIESRNPKMGGAFEIHIPLMEKIVNSLINNSVIWSTWNPKNNPTKWDSDSWFYRLEQDESININLEN